MRNEDDIIFDRKFYDTMLRWKERNGERGVEKKSLLIEGARRIGKTVLVKRFAEREYESYVYIDFSVAAGDRAREIFRNHMENLDDFFDRLSDMKGVTLFPGKSAIVLDEIQEFPLARARAKEIVDDGRYDCIETGSLLRIKENVDGIEIPGNEHSESMYPMDFEEFCWALGEKALSDDIREHYDTLTPLKKEDHEKAMGLFRKYLVIGGMPQSVKAFILNSDNPMISDREKRDILDLYGKDMGRIQAPYDDKVRSVYDQIPGNLSRREKRIKFKKTAKGKPADTYEDLYSWLEKSMVCNMCFKSNDPQPGALSLNESRAYIKCYMGDTGLLFSHAFDDKEIIDKNLINTVFDGKTSLNNGMLYENVMAQALACSGRRLFFYTEYNKETRKYDTEVDFIISVGSESDSKLIPIDVKSSSKKPSLGSLNRFRDKFSSRIAYSMVIHPKPLRIDNDLRYIPWYMIFCL